MQGTGYSARKQKKVRNQRNENAAWKPALRFAALQRIFRLSRPRPGERGDYIPFIRTPRLSLRSPASVLLAEIYTTMESRLNKQSFDTFVELCCSIELITDDGRFAASLSRRVRLPTSCRPAAGPPHGDQRVCLALSPLFAGQPGSAAQRAKLDEIQRIYDELAEIGTLRSRHRRR